MLQTDSLTDEAHSDNRLQLYEGGGKKEQCICKSERTAEINFTKQQTSRG